MFQRDRSAGEHLVSGETCQADRTSGVATVAHYYWSENRNWIDERMADLIATYQRWETAGAAITASKYPCSRADNIRQLETDSPRKQDPEFRCNYSLGERIFLDLLQTMGEVSFREGAQRLYDQSMSGDGGADVEDVRTAFNSPEIVKKWYSGNRSRGSAQVDESPPTWKLEEIHGTINNAEIIFALCLGGFEDSPTTLREWHCFPPELAQYREQQRITYIRLQNSAMSETRKRPDDWPKKGTPANKMAVPRTWGKKGTKLHATAQSTSRPFPRPESGRIAVKVINHLGDEVMKVFRVG